MKKIAIDLTWVRHKKVGGTESSVRNLLDGLVSINPDKVRFILLLARDNADSFDVYSKYECFSLKICNVYSQNQWKRVLWQNFELGKLLRTMEIDVCLEPVYGKPFIGCRKIKFFTVIHDLQAYHYPEYFSKLRVIWMKLGWWNTVHTSHKVIAISEYVKKDILNHYRICDDKVVVIYDAINVDTNSVADKRELQKYGVLSKKFYYTVSSLLPHKNLSVLINMLYYLKQNNSKAFLPLVISGIGGKSRDELLFLCEEKGLSNDVIITPFVENDVRNLLYSECKAFLFPSVFEGFGMPPIEAMAFGTPVVTTRCASIPEVTGELCNYVKEPSDAIEWGNILISQEWKREVEEVGELILSYSINSIAREYIDILLDGY